MSESRILRMFTLLSRTAHRAVLGILLLIGMTIRANADSESAKPVVGQVRINAGSAEGSRRVAAAPSPLTWTLGAKRVLWVRLDFSDAPGSPATDAQLAAIGPDVNNFYVENSGGRTTMTFTLLPSVLRLPRTKAAYEALGFTGAFRTAFRGDAQAAAKAYDSANGNTGAYDTANFDRVILIFSLMPSFGAGAFADGGQPTVYLMTSGVDSYTVNHELGHTMGLPHAASWVPTTSSPIGPGTFAATGDPFDRMGSGGLMGNINLDFNVSVRAILGYLDGAAINNVATNGTYRLTRHDHKDATGVRALRLGASHMDYEFWIEYRRIGNLLLNSSQLERLQNGVLIHWGPQKPPNFVPEETSYLLDMTPGSSGGMNDAALRVGESFTDPDSGITIKPVGVGGTAPNEYIDVQVSFGAISPNHNPVLVAAPPSGPIKVRSDFTLAANATDLDGDPLYYRWNLGDGKVQPKLATVTGRYFTGGSYPIFVSAHDGKGGLDFKSYTLDVVDPLMTWTKRTSPYTVNNFYDVIFASGKFVAVGDLGAVVTSTDGVNWDRAVTPSNTSHFRAVAYNGARFAAVGISATTTVRATAAYSNDGTTWTAATLPTGVGQIGALAYGAGRFVAVGETGRIYSSTDGARWTETTSPVTTLLRAVTFANGLFVIVGDSGRSLVSTDGLVWSNRSMPDNIAYTAITYYNGAWFAFNGAAIYSSPDASTWNRLSTSSALNLFTSKSISTNGVLLNVLAEGRVGFSEDGQTWANVQLDPTAGAFIRSASAGVGVLVAVGTSGGIFSAALTVPPVVVATNPARLINLSVLTEIATVGDDFTLGYVVGGGGTFGAKPLVIRAAGPSLGAFGVPGTLDDPKFELFAGSTKTSENDNWGGSNSLSASLSAVGAFAYIGPSSKDAATTASITTRDNSVKVSGVGSSTGKVIAEIYDATPAGSFTTTTPRLINVSVRKNLGSGLTMGFVVGGATPAKVLVRGIGPTLGAFGVPGTVVDPQLTLFNSSSVKIGENNDWAGTVELTAAFASVGAFALPATSKDAALLVTLAPGNYTAQVIGANGTTGVALVEVYEVP